MKYRKDFVANSSSSSYVCDVCGCNESGYDMGLSEAEMVECENGHTFCEHHIEMNDDKRSILLSIIKELCDEDCDEDGEENVEELDNDELLDKFLSDYEGRYDAPECLCPICSFENGYSDDIVKYMQVKYQVTDKGILEELKGKFKSYEEFKSFLKKQKV